MSGSGGFLVVCVCRGAQLQKTMGMEGLLGVPGCDVREIQPNMAEEASER